MENEVRGMVSDALDAFVNQNVYIAKRILAWDDVVDKIKS